MIYNEPSHRRRRILHAWGLSKAVCSNFKNTSPMAGTDRLPLSMNQCNNSVSRKLVFENIFSLLPIGLYIQSDQPIKPAAPKHKYLNVSSFQNGENGVNVNTF